MVTTSSCSGRVSVFLEGVKQSDNVHRSIGAKGHEGRWLFVTHEPSELPQWYERVDFEYGPVGHTDGGTRYILFKFEPLILHVKCRNTAMANKVYQAAMGCGFRESGIGTNDIVGIRISIKLDIPIGYLQDDKMKAIVTKEYLELVTTLANDRFTENFRKLEQLERAMASIGEANLAEVETKEQRRERKVREGLERQRIKKQAELETRAVETVDTE